MRTAEEYHEEGLHYLNEGYIDIAVLYFEKAIENNIKNPESYIKIYELKKEKDINLIIKSIDLEENKWSYIHLLSYYLEKNLINEYNKVKDNYIKFIEINQEEENIENKTIYLEDLSLIYEISNKIKKSNFSIDNIEKFDLEKSNLNDIDYIENLKLENKKDYIYFLYYFYIKNDFIKFDLLKNKLYNFSKNNKVYYKEIKNFLIEKEIRKNNEKDFKIHPFDIRAWLKESDLRIVGNQLECIALMITGNELNNGYYDFFIKQLENTNINYSNKIDLKIFSKDIINLKIFKKYFKEVSQINLNIPIEYDFYLKEKDIFEESCIDYNLKYGEKSGPNYVFYHIFDYLKNYNTTLFLECDCFLSNDWIEKIINYTSNHKGFWISGAVYDGKKCAGKLENLINTHINGGTALYATGNTQFQKFIDFYRKSFFEYIKKYKNFPYDYLIKKIIDDYFENDKNYVIWNFIRRQYIFNNLIINLSTERDAFENMENYKNIYNFAILHKKNKNLQ